MRVKYSPQKAERETQIQVNGDTVAIDGEVFEFDSKYVEWQDIIEQTGGKILEAHRENGVLCITVLRQYNNSCTEWDTGGYHEIER